MPYIISKRVGGYGVRKKAPGSPFLSKKPMTKSAAIKQRTAVEIAESKYKKKNNNGSNGQQRRKKN